MSVATVEHSNQALPPLENPCPDLPCWSLNREQKERGLTFLQRTRKELGERQLEPLRSRRAELQAQYARSDSNAERQRLSREINRIDANAQDVLSRWS
ncbi:hypothetical protein [Vibrio cyclitrophicus]|uniref:hypothetical protein n=1 Tax=Vibrio cyclitrophicus TaxID=47951 RepID=UPI00030E1B7D|nr:hypothetical protein [Vibrio cyclitrophicus]ERM57989.1 hypothetical protein M565_ctg5P0960 [Vibrio cyclitrophicus FF75]OEE49838.1 hypothetical protein OAG_00025 [Vibrio cyclitrophicus FF75]